MELYETVNSAEKFLQMKADKTHTPLGGSVELLPLCNMNCKMCYVRQSKEEMDAQGRMLTCNEWLSIVKEACEQGVLFLLLTGGEPLLYPEFKRLYTGISNMGVVMTINTNGTLIDEDWADFFAENGVRRINITLYGKDDATYGTLCGNPNGFTQVMRAAKLLKERDVAFRFTCSLTPDNIDQLPEIHAIVKSFDVPLAAAAYMFPAARRGKSAGEQFRLTAEQAAGAVIQGFHIAHPDSDMEASARLTLSKLDQPPRLVNKVGFPCHAGHSGFWMSWKGELMPCGMFQEPRISLLEHSFADCWDYIVDACEKMEQCQACKDCKYQNICSVCPANCYAEIGSTAGCPDYVCEMTNAMIREMERIATDGYKGKLPPA